MQSQNTSIDTVLSIRIQLAICRIHFLTDLASTILTFTWTIMFTTRTQLHIIQ